MLPRVVVETVVEGRVVVDGSYLVELGFGVPDHHPAEVHRIRQRETFNHARSRLDDAVFLCLGVFLGPPDAVRDVHLDGQHLLLVVPAPFLGREGVVPGLEGCLRHGGGVGEVDGVYLPPVQGVHPRPEVLRGIDHGIRPGLILAERVGNGYVFIPEDVG